MHSRGFVLFLVKGFFQVYFSICITPKSKPVINSFHSRESWGLNDLTLRLAYTPGSRVNQINEKREREKGRIKR